MPAQLEFDPAAFGDLANALDHAAENLKKATSALRGASAGDLGSHGIDNAAKRFQQRWSDGIGKIAQAADSMVDGMKQASTAYTTTDGANSDSIASVSGALGPAVGRAVAAVPAQDGTLGSLNLGAGR